MYTCAPMYTHMHILFWKWRVLIELSQDSFHIFIFVCLLFCTGDPSISAFSSFVQSYNTNGNCRIAYSYDYKIKPNKKSLVCFCNSPHSHHCLTLNVCTQILCSYFILISLSFFASFLLSFIVVTVFIWYIIVCISLYILFICLYILSYVIYVYISLSFPKDNICALLYIAFFYLPIFPGN